LVGGERTARQQAAATLEQQQYSEHRANYGNGVVKPVLRQDCDKHSDNTSN